MIALCSVLQCPPCAAAQIICLPNTTRRLSRYIFLHKLVLFSIVLVSFWNPKKSPKMSSHSSTRMKRGSRSSHQQITRSNFLSQYTTEESVIFMKEDIDTIIVSLKSSITTDLDNIRRTKSLLETLLSFLLSNKCNPSSKYSINFTQQILSLDNILTKVNMDRAYETDRAKVLLLCEVENLIIKNIRNLLKITSDPKSDSFATLFEHLIDLLIEVRIVIPLAARESTNELRIQLDCIALSMLKCLFFVASKCEFHLDEIHKANICAKFIGILRCFSFYGLDNYELDQLSINLYPSPISQLCGNEPHESTPKKRRGKLDENQLLEDDTLFNSSVTTSFSTSEYSSSELEDSLRNALSRRETQHNKKIYAKMRMLAYESLQCSLPLFSIRVVFGFWSFLFPDEPNASEAAQYSVLYTIAKDTSNRVRTSALNFTFNFFNFGKFFVRTLVSESSHARPTSSKAFTPLSESLTSMIKELHSFFGRILMRESNSAILILIYKVVSLIVSITPYTKLFTDILHPLFYQNSFLLDHKVTQIRNLSLVLYVKIFSTDVLPKKFYSWLNEDKLGLETLDKLFRCCFEFSANPEFILLCIESIKLLTCMVKHHALMVDLLSCQTVNFDVELLRQMSIDTLQSDRSLTNPVLQSLICKFVHSLGMLFKHISSKNVSIFASDSVKCLFLKDWFLQVFGSKLFRLALVELDLSLVRSSTQVTLINVISVIPEEVFILMDSNAHFEIISILMALSKEDIPQNVTGDQDDTNSPIYCKSAAIRCLSIILSFDCLSDDINLTFDLIEICLDVLTHNMSRTKSQKKKELFLLEHSLWALANICDVIKKKHLNMEIDSNFLNRIVTCLNNCYELNRTQHLTDDILVNLVRSSGIVIYIILYKQSLPHEQPTESLLTLAPKVLPQSQPTTYLKIVRHMLEFVSTKRLFKLQWNICIALSYLLSLDAFVTLCRDSNLAIEEDERNMLLSIYDTLFRTYKSTPNHKVESYSIYTICSVPNLDCFPVELTELWSCVVDKFIAHFNTVPVHSHQSWLEKYVFALEALIRHFAPSTDQSDTHLLNLREFVSNELVLDNNAAPNTEQIHKLHSLINM